MTAPALLLAVCALALAGRAAADELHLRPTLTLSQAYDDNVRNLEDTRENDLLTIVSPGLVTRYRTERGGGTLRLDLRARQYWDHTDLNALDRSAYYDVDYLLTQRFTLASSGHYDYYEQTDDFTVHNDVVAGTADTNAVTWDATGRYSLGKRTAVWFTPSYYRTEYGDQDLPYCYLGSRRLTGVSPPCPRVLGQTPGGVFTRVPSVQPVQQGSSSDAWATDVGIDRNITDVDTGSLRIGKAWRDFSRGSDSGSSTDTSDNANTVDSVEAGWRRAWSPRFSTRLSLGVERVKADSQPIEVTVLGYRPIDVQTSLNAFDDTNLIGIGSMELSYTARTSLFSLRYARQSNPSVTYGTSLDTQTVSGSFEHRLNSRLTLDLGGFWSHQESLGDSISELNVVPTRIASSSEDTDGDGVADTPVLTQRASCGASAVEVYKFDDYVQLDGQRTHLIASDCLGFSSQQASYDSMMFTTGLNWQMTKQFSTFVRYRWYKRSAAGDTRLTDYDKNVFTLGFAYSYDIDLY